MSGKSLALIFYADQYQSLKNLVTPKNDANRLSSVLKTKYGYETKIIPNPDRREFIQELNAAQSLEENDKLLVFFAGHGKSEANTSFWLPVDASPDDDTQWLEDNTIKRKLSLIPARNVLVVADTCFLETLLGVWKLWTLILTISFMRSLRPLNQESPLVQAETNQSWILLAVSTQYFHPLFCPIWKNWKTIFSARARQGYLHASPETSIKAGMKQSPRFGELNRAGHEGLGFVFYPKDKKIWNKLVATSSSY